MTLQQTTSAATRRLFGRNNIFACSTKNYVSLVEESVRDVNLSYVVIARKKLLNTKHGCLTYTKLCSFRIFLDYTLADLHINLINVTK